MKSLPRGFVMIEALVAILIFCLGVLGLVAMGSAAINTQSDARYRTDAAALAEEIANKIAFNVNRGVVNGAVVTNQQILADSVSSFQYNISGDAASCAFSGGTPPPPSGTSVPAPIVADWLTDIQTGTRRLPGASTATVQILDADTTMNKVQITLCWKAPNDLALRRYTLVTFVN